MKQKVLDLLGLAKKAGKMITGEDGVILGLQKRSIKIVFVAKDASAQTIERFDKKCFFYKVDCITDFTCEEISNAIGSNRTVIGITDAGFTKAIKEKM